MKEYSWWMVLPVVAVVFWCEGIPEKGWWFWMIGMIICTFFFIEDEDEDEAKQ